MEVREIKELTLELARSGDRIEGILERRRELATKEYEKLAGAPDLGGPGPLLLRVTTLPLTPQNIPSVTTTPDLWWRGRGFVAKVDQDNYDCSYAPAQDFHSPPVVRLRSL